MSRPQTAAAAHQNMPNSAASGAAAATATARPVRVGVRVDLDKGPATVERLWELQGVQYCLLRLDGCGSTVSMPLVSAERLPRRPTPRLEMQVRTKGLVGHVRTYNPLKGWGFIVCDEVHADIFLHSKNVVGPTPSEYIGHVRSVSDDGPRVSFDLDVQGTRPQALNVRLLDSTGKPKEEPGIPPRPTDLEAHASSDVNTPPIADAVVRPRPRLYMRGIPWSSSPEDVAAFFEGFGVHPDDVTLLTRKSGKGSGAAYVQFVRQELADRALAARHMQHMGQRYIELYPVSLDGAIEPVPAAMATASAPATPPRRLGKHPPEAVTPEPMPAACQWPWPWAETNHAGGGFDPLVAMLLGVSGCAPLGPPLPLAPLENAAAPWTGMPAVATPPLGNASSQTQRSAADLAKHAYFMYQMHLQEASAALLLAQQHLAGQRDERAAAILDALPPLAGLPFETLAALGGAGGVAPAQATSRRCDPKRFYCDV
mmetsp:Transcript_22339/g.63997  ORF Transcript_22339/g.63997 Transcript_22339/m.63997 type:complete len:484 (-) Transcript_22339:79-1530(-)